MDDLFQSVDGLLSGGAPVASLEFLIEEFRREKNYPAVFEARMMRCRHELGLPVIQTEEFFSSFPTEQRQEYEKTFVEAAREVAEAYLADGRIERAWPSSGRLRTVRFWRRSISWSPQKGRKMLLGLRFRKGCIREKDWN